MQKTKLFAVTGNPVLHSKSPNMFNAAFEQMNIDGGYFRLAANSAREAVDMFKMLGLQGMNVTAPFKEEIIACLDDVDAEAILIGGVNTVVNEGGKLKGYNTDHYGVANSLLNAGVQLRGANCVVIGCGGAGKAAAYGLLNAGAEVTIANRTVEKAQEAAHKLGCNFAGLTDLETLLPECDVVVFSLAQDVNPINAAWLRPHQVVFDANYKHSAFCADARTVGCTIVEGLDWLLNQAIPAFRLFLNCEPDVSAMKRGLTDNSMAERSNTVAMIGFMGAGKTSNSKLLATKMNRQYCDTDDMIVERAQMTIPEIFKDYGEEHFRQLERSILQEAIVSEQKYILSCGGGIVVHPQNRLELKQHCLTVWLFASPETVVSRIKPGTRPLLAGDDPVAKARQILAERIGLYGRTADIIINTENKTLEQITTKIYEEISKTFGN